MDDKVTLTEAECRCERCEIACTLDDLVATVWYEANFDWSDGERETRQAVRYWCPECRRKPKAVTLFEDACAALLDTLWEMSDEVITYTLA